MGIYDRWEYSIVKCFKLGEEAADTSNKLGSIIGAGTMDEQAGCGRKS